MSLNVWFSVCFSLMALAGEAQVWDDFESPYQDTSFQYDLIEGEWEMTQRTIEFNDEYDETLLREHQEKDSTGEWRAEKRDRYTRPEPGKTLVESIKWKDGKWVRSSLSTYEYFPNSSEHRRRQRKIWDSEKQGWRLDYEYERTYQPGTRQREDITRYYNDEGLLRHGQRDVIEMGLFGEEEVKEVYKKGLNDSIWEALSRTELIRMGDSTWRERRRWNEEQGEWGQPVERDVRIYYREDEYLPQPVRMKGGSHLKEKRNDRFDQEEDRWMPDSRELIEYEDRDSGYIRRTIQYEWNPVKNEWRGISRMSYEYDGQGHSRGYLRETYDKENNAWTPDSRSRVKPGKDGYLHSIREKWDEEKGGWNSNGKRRFQPCYPVSKPEGT